MPRLNIRTQIIEKLASGLFVSGQVLSQQLAVSRSSISCHIRALNKMGLDIYSVKGKGYKLASPLSLIQKTRILDFMHEPALADERVFIQNVVESTNDAIKADAKNLRQGSAYLAEAQTKGRGRRGRVWQSPYGASIYMSMLWRFESGYQSIAGLSLLVGIAVRRTIAELGCQHAQLKWPNDVYIASRKVAGILIEVEGQVNGLTEVIIGIGLNVNLPDRDLGIEQAYTDLCSALKQPVDRNRVIAVMLQKLWSMLEDFELRGLLPYLDEWAQADMFQGKEVVLTSGKHIVQGICRGIDAGGALLVESEQAIKAYHGGEISVRPTVIA